MKKKSKWLVLSMCLMVFALMALGSGSDSSDSKSVSKQDGGSKAKVTINEQVLVDQDGIVVTAKEYESDSIWGDSIKLLVENNSDRNVTVGCKELIVNDYMISDLFVADVAAGKKSNEKMSLSSSELKAAGIDSVGKIEIYFHVYDSDSYDDIFNTDVVTIQTSEFENMDTTPNDTGSELYNEGGIRIVGKTVDEDSFWGSAVLLYIENTSGRNVGVQCDDMSINGFMTEPLFSCDVYNNKKAIDDITILSSDLEKNGIEKIENIELRFHIFDVDTYETITDSDPITFSAQ